MSKETWASYGAFIRDRLQLGETLVVPVRLIWDEYCKYCGEWGFQTATTGDFIKWLAEEEGVRLRDGKGRGKLKRVALGIGFNAGELQCAS